MRFSLGLLALAAGLALTGCNARQIAACKPADDVICDVSRAEDIEIVPNTRWLLATGERDGHRILLIDPDTKEVRPLLDKPPVPTEAETFPRCGPPPPIVGSGAFHLSTAEDGSQRLLVLNGKRVERYRLTITGDDVAVGWEGCVAIPDELAPNDIAALGDRGFVISHMFSMPRSWTTQFRLMLGLNTGAAYRWTRDGGWARIPNSDASFANGIQVDPKTERVYVASMFNQRILAVDVDGKNPQVSARIPEQNDNLSWTPDGQLIGVGHTGVPILGTQKCKDLRGTPCAFPFAVIAIDPKTLVYKTIFQSRDRDIPGASVAVLKNGKLYLGTVFGDRITIVKPEGETLPR